jgi:hypothetical protein
MRPASICTTDEVPDYIGGKQPSLSIIGRQEFDDAEPVLLILPVGLESSLCFVPKIARSPCSRVLVKTRDTQTIHRASVPLYSLLLFTGHYGATGAL